MGRRIDPLPGRPRAVGADHHVGELNDEVVRNAGQLEHEVGAEPVVSDWIEVDPGADRRLRRGDRRPCSGSTSTRNGASRGPVRNDDRARLPHAVAAARDGARARSGSRTCGMGVNYGLNRSASRRRCRRQSRCGRCSRCLRPFEPSSRRRAAHHVEADRARGQRQAGLHRRVGRPSFRVSVMAAAARCRAPGLSPPPRRGGILWQRNSDDRDSGPERPAAAIFQCTERSPMQRAADRRPPADPVSRCRR